MAQDVADQLSRAIEDVVGENEAALSDWWRSTEEAERKAQQSTEDLLLDSIFVDGKSLRDLVGPVMLKKRGQDVPERVSITWNGPSPDEIARIAENWGEQAEYIGKQIEKHIGNYTEALEQI